MHRQDALPREGKAWQVMPARSMLLPGNRLQVHRLNRQPPGSSHAHLTGDHKWRSKQVKYNVKFTLQVQEGMRVLHSRDGMPLFLVKFALSPPLGNVTSVLCVDPHATTKSKFKCHLSSNCLATGRQQSFDFQVRNTTLSNGLPQTEDGDYSLFPSSTSSITVIMKKIEQKHLRQSLLPYVAAR
jgi:hypothetical protein